MGGRIRTIKPELNAQPRVAGLTDAAFRLFVGCVSLADDAGRLLAGPTYLAGQIFFVRTRSANAIGKLISELEAARLVDRYVVDGVPYLAIIGWAEKGTPSYQRIDKPQPAQCPAPRLVRSWNEFVEANGTDPIRSDLEAKGAEGDPDREQKRKGEQQAPAAAPSLLPDGWQPSESLENRKVWRQLVELGIEDEQQQRSFRRFCDTKRAKGVRSSDWDAEWREWTRREKPAQGATSLAEEGGRWERQDLADPRWIHTYVDLDLVVSSRYEPNPNGEGLKLLERIEHEEAHHEDGAAA